MKAESHSQSARCLRDGYQKHADSRTGSQDRRASHQVRQREPQLAKIMADNYLTELRESLREETLKDAAKNRHFLWEQIEQTSDPLFKVKISDLLAKEIKKETIARTQKNYGFIVLNSPVASDLDKEARPKRAMHPFSHCRWLFCHLPWVLPRLHPEC